MRSASESQRPQPHLKKVAADTDLTVLQIVCKSVSFCHVTSIFISQSWMKKKRYKFKHARLCQKLKAPQKPLTSWQIFQKQFAETDG